VTDDPDNSVDIEPIVLDQIYEAAFNPSAFSALAGLVAKAMQAANGVVVIARNGIPVDLAATTSREAQLDYLNYYGRLDIWTPRPASIEPFKVNRSQELVSDQAVLHSEFYNDYARHLDMWHPIGVTSFLTPELTLLIGVNRTPSGGSFSSKAERRLVELAQHVQRAMQLRRRFQETQTLARAGFAVLDKLAFAAIVVEADGRIVFANAAAEELHRSGAGLTLAGGRLGCLVPQQNRILNDCIRSAAAGHSGGALQLTGQKDTALLTLIAPLPRRLSEHSQRTGLALITVRHGKDSPLYATAMLGQLFGLSRAETEVACALTAGFSLEEIAVQRGVRLSTIKTQIEAAFRKTGTESQRELVAKIASLPPLRPG
jgi:DNA-binding CsgD family transcriptional regulator